MRTVNKSPIPSHLKKNTICRRSFFVAKYWVMTASSYPRHPLIHQTSSNLCPLFLSVDITSITKILKLSRVNNVMSGHITWYFFSPQFQESRDQKYWFRGYGRFLQMGPQGFHLFYVHLYWKIYWKSSYFQDARFRSNV